MALEPGYHVSKQIRLVRMVGRGGMGSVWIADHLALKTHVAVKFMSSMYVHDPALVTRFEREATSAAQIKSPHIVQVHDHGMTEDGIPFIVMELLDGEDLSSRLKHSGPLPPHDVAIILMQMCKALNRAHQLGIIHRDIKPGNVFLLDTDGDIFVKLLDFGIAKPGTGESSDVTNTGAIVGTVVYMSPEQLLNAKSVDYRADLWSAAVVAYRALTGRLPFSDEDGIGSLCLAFEQSLFKAPSELDPSLPAALDAWFTKAFQRKPENRFGSAKEMVRAFFDALGETPHAAERGTSRVSVSDGQSQDTAFSEAWDAQTMRTLEGLGPPDLARKRKLGPDDPTTHDSNVSARLAADDMRKASEQSSSGVSAVSKDSRVEPITAGTGAPMTVDGTASSSAQGRSKSKSLLLPSIVLGLLVAGGAFFGLQYLRKSPIPPSEPAPVDNKSPEPQARASSTAAEPPAPSTEPKVLPASTASEGIPAPSVPPSAAAPSAAPPISSIPIKATGTAKPKLPEKDYGF